MIKNNDLIFRVILVYNLPNMKFLKLSKNYLKNN